jgi:hypothetical protein
MTKDEALRLALEALKKSIKFVSGSHDPVGSELDDINEAITAIKAALEVKDESVAKYSDIISDGGFDPRNQFDVPPQRTWVGLTDDEKYALCKRFPFNLTFDAIAAIEAKLKEKNG